MNFRFTGKDDEPGPCLVEAFTKEGESLASATGVDTITALYNLGDRMRAIGYSEGDVELAIGIAYSLSSETAPWESIDWRFGWSKRNPDDFAG